MNLAYVDLCGFRGYRDQVRIDFPDGFTVIDGRNGVGKSTIFDAVEFALTGTIAKYGGAKASGETVDNYLWWIGEGRAPAARYVEVGFRDGDAVIPLRREQLNDADQDALKKVVEGLCDIETMPRSALPQLCAASIIRDEHIAALSLDLSEAKRYELLCDAIGATDADTWIARGSTLVSLTKTRVQAAQNEADIAAREVSAAAHRIDEIRAALIEDAAVAEAAERLRSFANSTAAPDQLAGQVRAAVVEQSRQLEQLSLLLAGWESVAAARTRLPEIEQAISAAHAAEAQADAALTLIAQDRGVEATASSLSRQARDLEALVTLGRRLGLHNGHCPLCASDQSDADFENGLVLAESYARQLDQQAVEQAKRARARDAAEAAVATAKQELENHQRMLTVSQGIVTEFEQRLRAAGLPPTIGIDNLREREVTLRARLESARDDLRIVRTLELNSELERATRAESQAKEVYARAEERLGVARRTENRAQTLHNAARRAAGETLNRQLERVLPLMAELYRRLRPHPVWDEIEYKIRGDVRRFLKLQVGNELNPQFIFSSGQRRATGLAFLLSVNLSLAWSRWRTILLDDPVQHVDDFRSVQLAEVMAQLSAGGRQIICAVEDAALADLLCRRLPIQSYGHGKRVTLGPDANGVLTTLRDEYLVPLAQQALVADARRLAS
jgi:chromosome segregation protein